MERAALLQRVRDRQDPWDVVVVGGGATGLGCAVEAASRGYDTLLLDQDDFAKGTSSRSTKLIHGGVRYLRQGNIALVREALRERGLLMANAPHLVHRQPFVVPNFRWWEQPYYAIGLKLYDLLAGRLGIGGSWPLSRATTQQRVPTVRAQGLRGGVLYHDGQFDDARLAVSLAQTLADCGGVPLNHLGVTGLIKDGSTLRGVQANDAETTQSFEIPARSVVNATGVFVDELRRMDDPDAPPIMTSSQGIHLVLDRAFLPGDHAIMIPSTDDGRVLFLIPWHDRVLVGTTDTPVDEVSLEPTPMEDEVAYLIDHANRYLNREVKRDDILSTFAGLRPLVKADKGGSDTAAISREHAVLTSTSGLVTIAGGKWTTYHTMGQEAIDAAAKAGGLTSRPSPTESLRLHGYTDHADRLPVWRQAYGTDAEEIAALIEQHPEWGERLHPRLPYRWAEVVWAVRAEMACTLEDVLSRRTRALMLDAQAALDVAEDVAALIARERGKSHAWTSEQIEAFRCLASGYLLDG